MERHEARRVWRRYPAQAPECGLLSRSATDSKFGQQNPARSSHRSPERGCSRSNFVIPCHSLSDFDTFREIEWKPSAEKLPKRMAAAARASQRVLEGCQGTAQNACQTVDALDWWRRLRHKVACNSHSIAESRLRASSVAPKSQKQTNQFLCVLCRSRFMSHKGLREPHFLLVSSNPLKLMKNLSGVLAASQLKKIDRAISLESALLFRLAESHFHFATAIPAVEWRQKVSRFYYAAYNAKRAVSLRFDGSFSTESSDHQKISSLPASLPNTATYQNRLTGLRDDRNLADYSHLATEADLVMPVPDAEAMVRDFMRDCRSFLSGAGVKV